MYYGVVGRKVVNCVIMLSCWSVLPPMSERKNIMWNMLLCSKIFGCLHSLNCFYAFSLAIYVPFISSE